MKNFNELRASRSDQPLGLVTLMAISAGVGVLSELRLSLHSLRDWDRSKLSPSLRQRAQKQTNHGERVVLLFSVHLENIRTKLWAKIGTETPRTHSQSLIAVNLSGTVHYSLVNACPQGRRFHSDLTTLWLRTKRDAAWLKQALDSMKIFASSGQTIFQYLVLRTKLGMREDRLLGVFVLCLTLTVSNRTFTLNPIKF